MNRHRLPDKGGRNAVRALAGAWLLLLVPAIPVHAHRLDEYLQASTITIERDRVLVQMRLVPGALIWPRIRPRIDTNRDGVLAQAEIRAYADRFGRDLSLRVDGNRIPLRLLQWESTHPDSFAQGLGTIEVRFVAALPPGSQQRRLVFENWHAPNVAAYLVNALVPADPTLQIHAQNRNDRQSWYQLDYEQRPLPPSPSGYE